MKNEKTITEINGVEYDDSDLIPRQSVLSVIGMVEEFSNNIFKELGWKRALLVLFFMYFHPIEYTRMVVQLTKQEIAEGVMEVRVK